MPRTQVTSQPVRSWQQTGRTLCPILALTLWPELAQLVRNVRRTAKPSRLGTQTKTVVRPSSRRTGREYAQPAQRRSEKHTPPLCSVHHGAQTGSAGHVHTGSIQATCFQRSVAATLAPARTNRSSIESYSPGLSPNWPPS